MTNKPIRIHRKRTKGWRMPKNTVSVCRPGKFGNPYKITKSINAEESVSMFRHLMTFERCFEPEKYNALIDELRGKNVACFCKEDAEYCHGDVWLELANG